MIHSLMIVICKTYFCFEHLFISIYLFVWRSTGFTNHEGESYHGHIQEGDEGHGDVDGDCIHSKAPRNRR